MLLHANAKIVVTFALELSEAEAVALNAITGWSAESLVKAMEGTVGKSELDQHRAGLMQFFGSVRGQLAPAVESLRKARADLIDVEVKRRNARVMANAVAAQQTGV